jgi:hypothetical protein
MCRRGFFNKAKGDRRPIVIMTAGLTLTTERNIGALAQTHIYKLDFLFSYHDRTREFCGILELQ